MGDHRAECHVQFKFHDKEYKLDLDWVNWADYTHGIDRRVCEFFEQAYEDGMHRFNLVNAQAEWKAGEAEREKKERAEFERLKAKFEGTPNK